MKKILLTLFIIFFNCNLCFADNLTDESNNFIDDSQSTMELQGYLEYDDEPQETIYLEEQTESPQNTIYLKAPSSGHNVNFKALDTLGSKSLSLKAKKQIQISKINQLEAASKFSTQEYNINPVEATYSGTSGKLSVGTTYNSSLSSASLNYSTGLFTRYDGEHFAITTAYSKNANNGFDSCNDRIFLAPELKLTKRLSLLDVMQTDISQTVKQNEVVLRYKPLMKKYADDVLFEVGAAQSFYENNFINSSVKFSTRFKL